MWAESTVYAFFSFVFENKNYLVRPVGVEYGSAHATHQVFYDPIVSIGPEGEQ